MVIKIQYLPSILLIILILVFIQHQLPKKSAYNYIGLLNHQKHKKPKQTKIPEPKNDPQLPSKDTGQKMVKGKLSNNPYKIWG